MDPKLTSPGATTESVPRSRRIAAVALPFLRIELARAALGEESGPLALVLARPGGAIKDERSLLGNTRIDEVCPQARARGLRPRQTIASARARCAELHVRVVPLDTVREVLGAVAEALLTLGPTTSFDLERSLVWVDVTGCAHLHRTKDDPSGEQLLARKIQALLESRDHACRVALADGPEVAAALARYGRSADPIIVPPGQSRSALQPLPLVALPLSDDARHWLYRMGMRTIGDLQGLPRGALGARLIGPSAWVLGLIDGDDPIPLAPYVPPVVPEETATVEYGLESTDALLFVAKTLTDRLAARLAGRIMAASCLELVLELDRAFVVDEREVVVHLPLAAPLSTAADLLSVLRVRLESFKMAGPVVTVRLRATQLVARTAVARDLFVPEAQADRTLPRLVAELEAELGPGHVGLLTLSNRWVPSERSRLVPMGGPPLVLGRTLPGPDSPKGALLSGAPEPTRWLTEPIALEGLEGLGNLRWLVRQDFAEWWSLEGGASKSGAITAGARDFGTAWVESVAGLAWVEVDRSGGRAWIRGWMD